MRDMVQLGIGRSARRAYDLDDVSIVPSRRTRDVDEVSISWQIDACRFDVPMAVAVARELRELGVTWCEEGVPTGDLAGLTQLRPHLAALGLEALGGEQLGGVADVWPYLAAGVWPLRESGL